ncbi:hypothetical protein [Pontibacter sp. SGAir0037]|uniref:hypothetical protein n=1 Tax=Pontibacter sp. SGAir0037 TaxID=2571030 RepID=UPI0010CD1759|nr:hypothetical protein [Pontibacter sp. SGAir0037]QCR23927.1 hypothetical protein C1N53_17270 [Pontibacter sp. SGAir0037]
MKKWNSYFKVALYGAVATLALQVLVTFAVDPYLAAVFSPFYSVWIILVVVGWRKEHPRK